MTGNYKIGIMGGTFNPIHFGHLILAENAYDQFGLKKVLIMPTGSPPHKDNEKVLDEKHRIKMIDLAIKDNKHFILSDLEVLREGYTYTSDTLEILVKDNPQNDYYFIIGADSLFYIDKWYKPNKIFELSNIVVANRDYTLEIKISEKIRELEGEYNAKIFRLNSPNIDISSEEIRQRVKDKHSIKYLVPSEVEEYIINNQLFMKGFAKEDVCEV